MPIAARTALPPADIVDPREELRLGLRRRDDLAVVMPLLLDVVAGDESVNAREPRLDPLMLDSNFGGRNDSSKSSESSSSKASGIVASTLLATNVFRYIFEYGELTSQ